MYVIVKPQVNQKMATLCASSSSYLFPIPFALLSTPFGEQHQDQTLNNDETVMV